MPRSIYRPLTGKRRVMHMFTQLHVGPDHLLLVRSNRFEERYQRFYFKDIQALVLTGLPSRTWLQASMAVVAGTIFLLALTLVPNPVLRGMLGMLGVFPAVIGLADYFRGPRCQMILKTAVSNEMLPPVSRMAAARLVVSRLKPAIEQVQQGEWNAMLPTVEAPPVMAPVPVPMPPGNRLLVALFTLVTVDAIIHIVARVTQRNELLFLLFSTLVTEIVLGIAALYRRGSDQRWILYSLSGVVVASAMLDILGGVVIVGLLGLAQSQARRSSSPDVTHFLRTSYPQFYLWWGFGWRAVVAGVGWANLVIQPKAGAAPAQSSGGDSLFY